MTTLAFPGRPQGDTAGWDTPLKADLVAIRDVADAAISSEVDGTVDAQLTFPVDPTRAGQLVLVAVNDAGGVIAKHLVFKAAGVLSRGGPIWEDPSGRMRAFTGWHDELPDGTVHDQWEVKTSTDPAGSFPAVMLTRLGITADGDRGAGGDEAQFGIYSTKRVVIESGNRAVPMVLQFNQPTVGSVQAGTATGTLRAAEIKASTSGSGTSGTGQLDLNPGLTGTTAAILRVFRETNQTTATLDVFKADNSATVTFRVDAKTGQIYGLGLDGVTLTLAVLDDDPRLASAHRSSSVATMTRREAASNLNLTSGTCYGARATALAGGAFSKVRFYTGGTAPSGITGARVVVADAAGTILAQSADIASLITAANLKVEATLSSSVTIAKGTDYFIGLAYTGTSLQVKGVTLPAAMTGETPLQSRTTTWASGAVGNLSGAANGNLPYLDLQP